MEKFRKWAKSQIDYLTAKNEEETLTATELQRLAVIGFVCILLECDDLLNEFVAGLDYKTAGKCTRNRKKGE